MKKGLIVAAVLLFCAVSLAPFSQAQAFNMYYSNTNPGNTSPGDPYTPDPVPPNPWVRVSGPVLMPTAVGGKIWFARRNIHVETNTKTWTFVLTGPAADKYAASPSSYQNGSPPIARTASVTGITTDPGPPKKRTYTITCLPQPSWEVVELTRIVALPRPSLDSDSLDATSWSNCLHTEINEDTLGIQDAWFGVEGEDDQNITIIEYFPETVPISPTGHTFDYTGPGTIISEVIYEDPEGNPRPLGGIRWTIGGGGLAAGQPFSAAIVMDGMAGGAVICYAYDEVAGEYQYFRILTTTGIIPTLTEWGMIIMFVIMAAGIVWFVVRQRRRVIPA